MNIYKRQMKDLGIDIKQYSKMIEMPELITKKLINGNGEVVENMEINNFLRKNLFDKHQEIETNKDEKREEATNIKIQETFENDKIEALIQNHPNSIEVEWYLNKFNIKEYFEKYNITSWNDLEKRYNWYLNVGRIHGNVSSTTLQRLCTKSFQYVGKDTLYPLVVMLYDCLENGNIKKKEKNNYSVLRIKLSDNPEEQELLDWFRNYDLITFVKEHKINYKDFSKAVGCAPTSFHQILRKNYNPRFSILKNIKEFVENYETTKEESTTEKAEIVQSRVDIPKEQKEMQNEIMRRLLVDRLTEEEKTLIRLFGGKI